MELNHLKYFYYVAREGGFSRASRALRVAQPAITKTIKALEAQLGFKLFERSSQKVLLTAQGNIIYRKCQLIFTYLDEIEGLSLDSDSRTVGPMNFGTTDALIPAIPNVLQRLQKAYPKIYPSLVTGTAEHLLNLVRQGKLEGALVFHTPELSEELELRESFSLKFYLIIEALQKKQSSVMERFIGSREIDDESNRLYPTLTKLQKICPKAEITISSNSLLMHREMVLKGLGVSILPGFLIKSELAEKKVRILLPQEEFSFKLKLIVRRGKGLSKMATSFVEAIIEEILK